MVQVVRQFTLFLHFSYNQLNKYLALLRDSKLEDECRKHFFAETFRYTSSFLFDVENLRILANKLD